VLVHAGAQVGAVIAGAEQHGIYLRDRSSEPGCDGCLRISTGVVEHTRRCIEVLEEVLCAAR
jgi:histidinol-phosphate aminotransferase